MINKFGAMNAEGVNQELLYVTRDVGEVVEIDSEEYLPEDLSDTILTDTELLSKKDVDGILPIKEACNPESRSRRSIELDMHEAKCRYDYNMRRYATLMRDDPTQINAIGGYERSARSWKHRLEKLTVELRKCED